MQIITLYQMFFIMGLGFTGLNLLILACMLLALRASQKMYTEYFKDRSMANRTPGKPSTLDDCPACNGTGVKPRSYSFHIPERCDVCKGTGRDPGLGGQRPPKPTTAAQGPSAAQESSQCPVTFSEDGLKILLF